MICHTDYPLPDGQGSVGETENANQTPTVTGGYGWETGSAGPIPVKIADPMGTLTMLDRTLTVRQGICSV
jgi:hypothetical protein